jgi:hypothetical protein
MYRWLTSENDDVAWRYCEYDCKRNKETSNPGDVSRIQSMLTCHSYALSTLHAWPTLSTMPTMPTLPTATSYHQLHDRTTLSRSRSSITHPLPAIHLHSPYTTDN